MYLVPCRSIVMTQKNKMVAVIIRNKNDATKPVSLRCVS